MFHLRFYQRLIAGAFINAKIIRESTRTLWGVSRRFQRWLKPTSRYRSPSESRKVKDLRLENSVTGGTV
jgi:hypothetical protein